MEMSMEYSTLPDALRGARARSVMTAFRGSVGSTSPYARPTSFRYCPTFPKERPSNVGDSTRVISRRVIRLLGAAVATDGTDPPVRGRPAAIMSRAVSVAMKRTAVPRRAALLSAT
jgi:hypothetical protein